MRPRSYRELDLWDDPAAEGLVPVKKGRVPRLSKAGEIRVS